MSHLLAGICFWGSTWIDAVADRACHSCRHLDTKFCWISCKLPTEIDGMQKNAKDLIGFVENLLMSWWPLLIFWLMQYCDHVFPFFSVFFVVVSGFLSFIVATIFHNLKNRYDTSSIFVFMMTFKSFISLILPLVGFHMEQ